MGVYHDPKPGGVSNDWAGNRNSWSRMRKRARFITSISRCNVRRRTSEKTGPSTGGHHLLVLLIPDVFTFNILHSRLEERTAFRWCRCTIRRFPGLTACKTCGRYCAGDAYSAADLPGACCIALAVKLSSPGPVIFRQIATAWMASRSKCGSSVP